MDVSVSYEDAGSNSGGKKVFPSFTFDGDSGGLPSCLLLGDCGAALRADRGLGARLGFKRKANFFMVDAVSAFLGDLKLLWDVF